jgi:hypothetical protein
MSAAPKGRSKLAQGNALGIRTTEREALKGRSKTSKVRSPFQGFSDLLPVTQGGALGWS